MPYDRIILMEHIKNQFRIDWNGIHGQRHWARVEYHGLRVARLRNADELVAELFALLHDSCRANEHTDRRHGQRGAEFAESLNKRFFDLDNRQIDTLCYAIRHHSGGDVSADPTIQSCWDADRLDLGRVGIRPSPAFLSAEAAAFIDSAYAWSIS